MKKMGLVLRWLLVIFAATALIAAVFSVVHLGSIALFTEEGTPFRSFLVPGIMLALVVGGTNLYAAIINIQRKRNRYSWAITGGVAITLWVMIQMMLTGVVNWLQLLYLTTSLLVVLIAFQLKGKWLV